MNHNIVLPSTRILMKGQSLHFVCRQSRNHRFENLQGSSLIRRLKMDRKAGNLFRGWSQRPMRVYPWATRSGPKMRVHPVNKIRRWTIVRGDKVTAVNGPYEGQTGVVQVVLRDSNRLIVEGINVGTRMLFAKGDESRLVRPTQVREHAGNEAFRRFLSRREAVETWMGEIV